MSLWHPTSPCTTGACVRPPNLLAGAPRGLVRLAVTAAVACVGVVLTPVVSRCAAPLRDALVRFWCRTLVRSAGVRIRVSGAAPGTGGALLVANHVSWLDIPLLAAVRPARMLAKSEVRGWPVVGPLAVRGGTLFIARARPRALPGTVAAIAAALREGSVVAAFPEGSTWCGLGRGRFRRAVFQAAIDAGVPVQPVRIAYRLDGGAASTAPAFVGEDTLFSSLWRVVRARCIVADLRVLPELDTRSADRRQLAQAAQTALESPWRQTRAAPAPLGSGHVVRPRRRALAAPRAAVEDRRSAPADERTPAALPGHTYSLSP